VDVSSQYILEISNKPAQIVRSVFRFWQLLTQVLR